MTAHYLIRIDDMCPTQDGSRWNRLKKLLLDYHVRPLLAVIPDCRDPKLQLQNPQRDFWEQMHFLSDKGWAIAQHGYQHVYVNKNGGLLGITPKSEFAGLPYETQREKIEEGQKILRQHGLSTDIFVAPSHSFDHNTLRALSECSFRMISDGIALYPFWKNGLLWIPQLWWEPVEMSLGLHTICLHPQNLTESDFLAWEAFLKSHQDQLVDFEEVRLWEEKATPWHLFRRRCMNTLFPYFWRLHQRVGKWKS